MVSIFSGFAGGAGGSVLWLVLGSPSVIIPLFIGVALTFFLIFSRPRRGQMNLPKRKIWIVSPDGEVRSEFVVEVARTFKAQSTGLMFRTVLAEDKGMYFPMFWRGVWPMTMRNTGVALDILFIDRGVIKGICQGVPMCKRPVGFKIKCNAVLELRRGVCEKLGISEGDRVSLVDPAGKEVA